MRIALVSEHASPLATLGGADAGGQNVHVAELARGLARRGDEVVVHTRRDDPDMPDRVAFAPGVTVHHVDAGPPCVVPKDELLPCMGRFADRLAAAWEDARPDVVHAHFWMSALAALEAAGPLAVPVVHTFHALGVVKRRHQGAADTSPAQRLQLERRVVRSVDRIVATCTDEVFELRRLGADRGRISVVPCGVDLSLFRPDGVAAPRDKAGPRIVSIGRLVERKGVRSVVKALATAPGADLVIAGGPPAAELDADLEVRRLRAVAREAGVEDRVKFTGRLEREQVPALLRSADVVVSVPWYEPFGIVSIEAMACGVPVVASAVGGMIDTVVDGVTGVHVPPRDTDALAGVLGQLLERPGLRRRLGRAGVVRARERYGWDGIAKATREVYNDVSQRRRRAAAIAAKVAGT